MRPRRRQPWAGECVEDEPPDDDEQGVPDRAAGGLPDHQDGGDEASDQTREVPGLALEGLDELLDFLRGLRQLARWRLGHGLGATAIVNRAPSPAVNRGSSLLPTRSRGRPVWPTRSTISRRRAEAAATRNAPSRRYGALKPL